MTSLVVSRDLDLSLFCFKPHSLGSSYDLFRGGPSLSRDILFPRQVEDDHGISLGHSDKGPYDPVSTFDLRGVTGHFFVVTPPRASLFSVSPFSFRTGEDGRREGHNGESHLGLSFVDRYVFISDIFRTVSWCHGSPRPKLSVVECLTV